MKQLNCGFIAAFIIVLCGFGLSAQVKSSIVIIRPSVSTDWAKTYKKMADYFSPQYQKIADYLEGKAEGGFGSGFVVLDPAGRKIVITNQHVVSDANTVDLEFITGEDESIKISYCPVVFKDDTVDLAIIDIPDQTKVSAVPLVLDSTAPSDGSDVWSAGYPGLGNRPVWQLGKGVVTNRHLLLEDVGIKEYSEYIQHSATIDPGNSGGPLLYGPINDLAAIRVIGMNTLFYGDRQNTFFALSAKRIQQAVDKLPATRNAATAELAEIEAKAREFITSLTSSEWSRYQAERFVGYGLATRQGWTAFLAIVKEKKIADDWIARFFNGITPNVFREGLYYRMYKAFHDSADKLSYDGLVKMDKPANDGSALYRMRFTKAGRQYEAIWSCELGNWHIASINYQELEIKDYGQPKVAGGQSTDNDDSETNNRRSRSKASEDDSDEDSSEFRLNSGFGIGGGVSALPLITGWTPSFNAGIFFEIGIGKVVAIGGALDILNGTNQVMNGSQGRVTTMAVSFFTKLGYALGESRSFYLYPYAIIEPTASLVFVSTGDGAIDSPLQLGGSAGLGLELGLGPIAFGLEGKFNGVFMNSKLRLDSIPVKLYIVF